MNIRRIAIYMPIVKDKYYVSSNGDLLLEKSDNKYRFIVNGKRVACKKRITQILNEMLEKNEDYRHLNWIDNTDECSQNSPHYILKDGTILRVMYQKTDNLNGHNRRVMEIFGIDGHRYRFLSHRVIAHCFIENVYNMDVHHINGISYDNRVSNLLVLTPEEHRLLHGNMNELFNVSTTIERHFNK